MLRRLAVVVASSVVLGMAALPATASPTVSTAILGFASSATTLTYQEPVTFTGELVQPTRAADIPVANEPVQIEFQAGTSEDFVPVATGTTGTDGHFSVSATLPSGGYVRAEFAGDTGLRTSVGRALLLGPSTELPSRLVLDPIATSVPAGTPVTFSGMLQVEVDGAWQPFQGQPLALTMEPYTSSQSDSTYPTVTGADGRFSLTEPVGETSTWSVTTSLYGSYWGSWFPDYARAGYIPINAVSKTRIIGFSLPSHDEAHHAYYSGLYATGTVQAWNGTAWIGELGAWVDFYYRPKSSKIWHADYDAVADEGGYFRNIVGIHLGTADWQARVRPTVDLLPSSSTNTVTSTLTDHTRFASVDIYHGRSSTSIYGQITDWSNGQVSFSTLRGLKLHLYYRAHGSKTWHNYRTVTTGKGGGFDVSFAKNHGYYFRLVLPTQFPYLTSTSRTM